MILYCCFQVYVGCCSLYLLIYVQIPCCQIVNVGCCFHRSLLHPPLIVQEDCYTAKQRSLLAIQKKQKNSIHNPSIRPSFLILIPIVYVVKVNIEQEYNGQPFNRYQTMHAWWFANLNFHWLISLGMRRRQVKITIKIHPEGSQKLNRSPM